MHHRHHASLITLLGLARAALGVGLPLLVACGPKDTNDGDEETGATDTDVTDTSGPSGDTSGEDSTDTDVTDTDTNTDAVLTGTLGDLGELQPIVSANVIEYSGETITYLSTVPLTCEAMATSRWLGSLDASAQVVEIVYKSATTETELVVGGTGSLEVNYAKGGRSSAYEQGAVSGTVTLTAHVSGGDIAGIVDATYQSPAGSLHGPFAATFCPGGQEY
jgi:hypothetical protein